jgi:rod shape-determining protein MreD
MSKKLFFLIPGFYFFVLLQASFVPHFVFWGIVPNIVLVSVILINLFEKSDGKSGLISAIFAGFLLDIFSGRFVGFYMLICLGISVFIKYVLKNYIKLQAWI